MLILDLELRNFKSFGGLNRIHFPMPTDRQSLYLIGGLNGAGKTSVMQAFALCLLGRQAAGLPGMFESGRERRRHYEAWLGACFTQGVSRHSDHMALAVTLRVGTRHDVEIRRSWWFDKDGSLAEEAIDVRDKSTGAVVGGQDAETFVQALFPRRLADFVFFDGEDVRALDADGQAGNVVDGLDRLLNLEPVKRLQGDIRKLARARRDAAGDEAQRDALRRLEDREDELTETVTQLGTQQEELRLEILRLEKQHRNLSSHLNDVLEGKAPATMSQIDARAKVLSSRRKDLHGRLAKALSDWVFILPLLPRFELHEKYLTAEHEARQQRSRHKIETAVIDSFVDRALKSLLGSVIPTKARAETESALEAVRRDVLGSGDASLNGAAEASDFLDEEIAQAMVALRGMLGRDIQGLQDLAHDIALLDREYGGVLEAQQQMASRPGLDAVMKQRDELAATLATLRAKSLHLERQMDEHVQLRKNVRKASTNLRTELAAFSEDVKWLESADAVMLALTSYIRKQRVQALQMVDERLLEGLRLLLRKRSLVGTARVNRESFAIEVQNTNGHRVDLPSAGEHQLLALAFTCAMLQSAPTPLPFFIDTPLGRLDAEHRRNVVDSFLPSVSRQVFVLSTDEEIVGPLLESALPRAVATYTIVHHEDTSTSEWVEGVYFGKH